MRSTPPSGCCCATWRPDRPSGCRGGDSADCVLRFLQSPRLRLHLRQLRSGNTCHASAAPQHCHGGSRVQSDFIYPVRPEAGDDGQLSCLWHLPPEVPRHQSAASTHSVMSRSSIFPAEMTDQVRRSSTAPSCSDGTSLPHLRELVLTATRPTYSRITSARTPPGSPEERLSKSKAVVFKTAVRQAQCLLGTAGSV